MKNFLIYKSSAGSGKTYTLVKEYLKIVLNNPDEFRSTLAITFTNKAAEEMKSRIIERLKKLTLGEDEELEKTLINEGVKSNVRENAQLVFDNILHNYQYFSVSTIDSFFHRVIRSFARELKLQFGYEVVIDENEVLHKAVDDVFAEIGIDKEITDYLENYVYFNIDENKTWNIDREIKNLAGEILKERYIEIRNKNKEQTNDKLQIKELTNFIFANINKFENTLQKFGKEAVELMLKYGLTAEDFKGGRKSVGIYLVRLSRPESYDKIESFEPTLTSRKLNMGEDTWFKKDSSKKASIEKCVKNGLGKILEEVIKYYDNNFKLYITCKEILRTIFVIGIFNDIQRKLTLYRDENKAMLISDANILLNSVIGSAGNPFIYEKIGSYYKHFLIDEFQDTSTFQWKNLLPLITNSLSEQNISMVVGDVKQSIYRWRNGNMKLLITDIYDNLSAHKEQFEERILDKNRRSQPELIKFYNLFFSVAPQVLAQRTEGGNSSYITETYKDVFQLTYKTGNGYVRAEFIPAPAEDSKKSADIADEKLLSIIDELEADGVNGGDILVLTQRRKESSRAARLLLSAGKSVVSDESLLLFNSPKVKLILSLFKYLTNPDNVIASAEVLLNYNLFEEAGNFILGNLDVSGIESKIKELLAKTIGNEIFSHEYTSLYEITEKLINSFKLNTEPDAYLLRFQDAVIEYSSAFDNSIVNFLDWWETKQWEISIITPQNKDAVRITTIHKAKGLQSPVVIIPYANWDIDTKANRDFFWVSSEKTPFQKFSPAYYVRAVKNMSKTYFAEQYFEEAIATNIDNLNLLYVAFTRASDRLYVLCPQKGKNSLDDDKIEENIRDLKEIDTAQLIKYVIASEGELSKFYKSEKSLFEYGKKSKIENEKKLKIENGKTKTDSLQIKHYISSGWFGKLAKSENK